MLKGLRWPLLALVLAGGLLLLAYVSRPDDKSDPASATTGTATPTAPSPTPQPTPLPTSSTESATTPIPESQVLPPSDPLPAPENILVEALVGEIRRLNPLLAANNPVDRDITSLIFEGLTRTNEYGEVIPALAESWTVSASGLEYLFVLRDDVLWQDGLPFTADDVAVTLEMISDPAFPGEASLHEFWRTVEVDALDRQMIRFRLTQPLASFPDQLRIGLLPAHVFKNVPVDQLDRHPFNLSPVGTGPYQIETLTASAGQIDGIQLRVAPVYRERPEGKAGYWLDRVVFRTYPNEQAALDAFRQGEVNSISRIPYDLQADAAQVAGLSLYTAVEPHVGVLIYNWERNGRYVRNPRVRSALAHAIDRATLVSDHLLGRAILADSPLLPGSWAYKAGLIWPAYDLTLAKALMDTASAGLEEPPAEEETAEEQTIEEESSTEEAAPEATIEATIEATAETTPEPAAESDLAGTPEATPESTGEEPGSEPGGDETPTDEAPPTGEPEQDEPDFNILTLNDPALVGLAEDVAEDWSALGLEMEVEAVDAGDLHARLEAGDFGVALIELSFEPNADPDPYVFWHQGQYGSGQNFGAMDDRRISETLETARRDPTGVNRVIHYHQFQDLFAERVPALVLYYPLYIYAADTRLEGIQLGFLSSPSDRFRNIQDWVFAGTITD